MKDFDKQLNYWTHMLDESIEDTQFSDSSDEINEELNLKATIASIAGDKAKVAEETVIDDCIVKYVTSSNDDYKAEFVDEDTIQFTVLFTTGYHKGSYSYFAASDLDFYGYPDEDEAYVELTPSNRMLLDRWMDERGLEFDLETDPTDSDYELIDGQARYTDTFTGKIIVVDEQKATNWINSL